MNPITFPAPMMLAAMMLAAAAGRVSAEAPASQPSRPNIVFILADDMGYADARCYGGEIDTPAIDRLATEGLRFTHFRATPMCVTSRVALLSGMSYQANGRMDYERSLPFKKYLGRYRAGFQAIRGQRLARQRELGIIPPDFRAAPHTPEVRIWEELPARRQEIEDQRMAAYAAMLDEMDQGIARMLAFLDQRGVLDRTVVIFASDNGGYFNTGDPLTYGNMKPWLPGSNQAVGSDWGWVQNTPFNHFKQTAFEGGLAVPFIVRFPPALAGRAGQMTTIAADFTDLYPTFLHLAGATRPAAHGGQPLKPLTGKNFWPALVDGAKFSPPERFHWFQPTRALIHGDDKIVSIHDGPWQLFNLARDHGETTDLAAVHPGRCQQLADRWHACAESIGMSPGDRRPVLRHQHAWGWHRLQMVLPQLVATFPENGKLVQPGIDRFEMTFAEPLDFSRSAGQRIRLYAVSDEDHPVWDISLGPDHPAHGRKTLRVEGLPPLGPDTQYYLIIPPDAFRVGGKPAGRVNDGAYWWRFRTRPTG